MSSGIEIAGVLRSDLVPFSLGHCREAPEDLQRIGIPAALGEGARAVSFAALYDHAQPPLISRWVTWRLPTGPTRRACPGRRSSSSAGSSTSWTVPSYPPKREGPFAW